MATFAIDRLMLTGEFEFCGTMIECHIRFGHFPGIRIVTGRAVSFERVTMR